MALNCRTAWPTETGFIYQAQGAINVLLLMLWFPSMRWTKRDV